MCLRFLTAKPTAFIPGESFSADDAITGKRSKRNAVPSIRIGYHPGTTKLTVSSLEREQVTNDRLQATIYCRWQRRYGADNRTRQPVYFCVDSLIIRIIP